MSRLSSQTFKFMANMSNFFSVPEKNYFQNMKA